MITASGNHGAVNAERVARVDHVEHADHVDADRLGLMGLAPADVRLASNAGQAEHTRRSHASDLVEQVVLVLNARHTQVHRSVGLAHHLHHEAAQVASAAVQQDVLRYRLFKTDKMVNEFESKIKEHFSIVKE